MADGSSTAEEGLARSLVQAKRTSIEDEIRTAPMQDASFASQVPPEDALKTTG
jgi:hypothetical protein